MRYVSTWFPASSPAPTAKRKNYTVNQVNSRYSLTDPLFTYEKRRLDRKSQVLRNEKNTLLRLAFMSLHRKTRAVKQEQHL